MHVGEVLYVILLMFITFMIGGLIGDSCGSYRAEMELRKEFNFHKKDKAQKKREGLSSDIHSS